MLPWYYWKEEFQDVIWKGKKYNEILFDVYSEIFKTSHLVLCFRDWLFLCKRISEPLVLFWICILIIVFILSNIGIMMATAEDKATVDNYTLFLTPWMKHICYSWLPFLLFWKKSHRQESYKPWNCLYL